MAATLPPIVERRPARSKLMSARDAVREYVHDGDKVFLGYTTWATALEWEMARQRKQDLIPIAITSSAILPLAGCSKRIITAYLTTARSPWFTERFEAGEFEVEDYSNQSIALMLMAGALGLPFIPTKTLLGTDYLSARYLPQPHGFLGAKKAQVMQSPFDGNDVVALPALRPGVSCVHVQWADEEGNAAFWGGYGEVKWALWASERIVISADEIVPVGVLRSDPQRTIIPGFRVNAVVHTPFGALPTGLPGYYRESMALQVERGGALRSRESFEAFMAEWIDGCDDHEAFLAHFRERFGDDALEALRCDRTWEPARPIRYGWRS